MRDSFENLRRVWTASAKRTGDEYLLTAACVFEAIAQRLSFSDVGATLDADVASPAKSWAQTYLLDEGSVLVFFDRWATAERLKISVREAIINAKRCNDRGIPMQWDELWQTICIHATPLFPGGLPFELRNELVGALNEQRKRIERLKGTKTDNAEDRQAKEIVRVALRALGRPKLAQNLFEFDRKRMHKQSLPTAGRAARVRLRVSERPELSSAEIDGLRRCFDVALLTWVGGATFGREPVSVVVAIVLVALSHAHATGATKVLEHGRYWAQALLPDDDGTLALLPRASKVETLRSRLIRRLREPGAGAWSGTVALVCDGVLAAFPWYAGRNLNEGRTRISNALAKPERLRAATSVEHRAEALLRKAFIAAGMPLDQAGRAFTFMRMRGLRRRAAKK